MLPNLCVGSVTCWVRKQSCTRSWKIQSAVLAHRLSQSMLGWLKSPIIITCSVEAVLIILYKAWNLKPIVRLCSRVYVEWDEKDNNFVSLVEFMEEWYSILLRATMFKWWALPSIFWHGGELKHHFKFGIYGVCLWILVWIQWSLKPEESVYVSHVIQTFMIEFR